MSDIVHRLRDWRNLHLALGGKLFEEAADEIERLRNDGACPHVRGTVTQHCSLNFTLTAEEREAVMNAITLRLCDAKWEEDRNGTADNARARKAKREADTLLKLLERLK